MILVPALRWLALACWVEGIHEGSLDLLHLQRRHHVDLDLVAKAKGNQSMVEGVLEKMGACIRKDTFRRFNFVFGPKVFDFLPSMKNDGLTLNSTAAFPRFHKVD